MIVHSPELCVKDGTLRLRARIEYAKPAPGMPNALWFEMPENQERYLSTRMDAWAANLLLVAMRRGESLTLCGTISDQLAHGIEEYQRAAIGVEPKDVQRISVHADAYDSATEPLPKGVGLAFSGGVDSFYTLWSHIAPQERSPAYQITHGVFLQGVDIAYAEQATMRSCLDAYGELFASLGLELLTLRTNIRDLYPEADWAWMAYPHLSGVGLLFDKLFRRFYLAAGATYSDWLGIAYPLLDQFFSRETLDIVGDGAGCMRWEKIARLAPWTPVRNSLRVCFDKPNGLLNCCRCAKCLHTMICFDLAGELKNVDTFPLGYTRQQVRAMRFAPNICSWINDTRKRALQLGRRDIAFDLGIVIAASLASWSWKRAGKEIAARTRRYKKKSH